MANSQKFTLTFDAQLNVNQMKGALSSIQSELSKLKLPANISKGFQDTLEKLNSEVKNFENISAGGINSKNDLTKLEASANKVLTLYEKLQSQAKGLGNLSSSQLEKLFPESVTKNIEAARVALKGYTDSAKAATRDLEKANVAIEKINNSIASEQGKTTVTSGQYKQISDDLKTAEAEVDAYKQKIEELTIKQKQMENDLTAPKKSSKYRDLIKELDETKAKYEEVKQKAKELSAQKASVTTNEKQAESLAKLNTQLTEAQQKANAAAEALRQIESVEPGGGVQQLIQIIGQLTGLDMSKFSNDVNGAAQALQTYLSNALNDTTGNLRNFNQTIEQNHAPAQQMKADTDECVVANQRLNDSLQEVQALKKRIQYFFGLQNTINLVKRAIRGAFDTIKELDKAMTETAVVTDFNVSDMWAQLPEYTKRANELGVTTLAAYQAATLYYQQGLKTNEVNALSVETLKMARIAGLDAAEATDRMTNALRGFNMALTEANAQRVDDVYSELAANTASNVDEISTAMTKVASLAHNANMEFETTAAFLAQIIETTRESAETAGTALKTVVARFSEVKKLVDEGTLRGQDEEGQAIDVNKVGTALRTAGIDLNKYFLGEVGLDDIFMELASKWDSLTSLQQRYIATQAAGSRQQSRFIALMSDYARTQELVGKAYNANGAAARQFEKTQESLESKLARLKNAWDEFLMGLTNNQMVKGFVDLLTDLLNFVNKLTSGFDATTNSILKFGVALGGLAGGKALLSSGGLVDKGLMALLSGTGIGQALTKAGVISGAKGARPQVQGPPTADGRGPKAPSALGNLSNIALKGWDKAIGLGTKVGGLFGADLTGTAAGLTGIASALGAIAVAAGVVYTAYQLWLNLTPQGQLKQLEKYAKAMDNIASSTSKAADAARNAQQAYSNYDDAVKNAKTIEERQKAIDDRTEYVNQLLQENKDLVKYVESSSENGRFVLTINEDQLAHAVEELSTAATKAAAEASFTNAAVAGQQAAIYSNRSEAIIRQMSPEKYAQYRVEENNALSEMQTYAQQGYLQLLSGQDFDDDLANALASAFAQNFDAQEYLKQLKLTEQMLQVNVNYDSTEELAAEYKKLYGANPTEELLGNKSELRTAVASAMVNEGSIENASKIAELIQGPQGESYQALLNAWNGIGKMAEINLEGISAEDLISQLGFDKLGDAQLEEFAELLNTDVEGLGKHIAAQAEATKNIQAQARANVFEQMMRAGMNITTADQERINQMAPTEVARINEVATSAEGLLSQEDYQGLFNELINGVIGEEFATQLTNLFSSINLDDPIDAFNKLAKAKTEALQAGNDDLVLYVSRVQEANAETFTASNLVQSFITSADYESLTESLADFIKENGHISDRNIEELASSNNKLKQLLDSNVVSAKALANALTLIESGKITFDQLNDAMLKALGTGKSFEEVLSDVSGWIEDFDKGTDLKLGTEHAIEQLEELGKYVDNWEFGNEPTQAIWEHIFGPDTYEPLLDQFGNNFAKLEAYMEDKIAKISGMSENAGLGGIQTATAKGVTGLKEIAGSGGKFFNWDLSQFSSTTEAINEVSKALGVSQGMAESFILSWQTHIPKLRTEWNQLNFETQLQTYAENLGNARAITEQDLIALGASVDKSGHITKEALEEIVTKINKIRGDTKEPITVDFIVNWQDESGTALSGEDLLNKYKEQFGSKNREPITVTIPVRVEGDTYTGSTIQSTIDNAYKDLQQYINKASNTVDSEGLISHLLSQGLSQGQAETVANDFVSELNGAMLTKTIQVPEFKTDENGKTIEVTQKDVTISADTMDGLRQAEEAALQKANYSLVAQGLAGIDTTSYQNNVATATNNAVISGATSAWNTFSAAVENTGLTVPVTYTGGTVATGGIVKSFAGGSANTPLSPGFALTGEEGPEIVWNKNEGYAYVTGGNGPEFQNLRPGDRVFNAAETSRIFRNSSFARGGIFDSYASGGWKPTNKKNGGGGSGSGSKDSKKESTWRNELDWLYDLMEDIAEEERQQTIIQAKYDLTLKDLSKTGRDLYNLTRDELSSLQTQLDAQNTAYLKRLQQMGELQTLVNAKGYGQYLQWNQKDQTLEINWDKIEAIRDKDRYDEVTDFISRMEEVQDQMDDAQDAILDIKAQIQELQERYLQQYLDFQQKVLDAVVKQYQDTIDNLSELNDTLNDTNASILESIQKEVDLQRQIRDNTDTEQDLAELESRLAYLQRDTTGANAVEIRTLQQQLDEARNDYSDTLIDQAIDRLGEANDTAAQQREKQIELMQSQLDYWQESGALWGEVADLMATGFGSNGTIVQGSELWDVLKNADSWDGLSEAQKKNWANELILEANEVGAHLIQMNNGLGVDADLVRQSIADTNGILTHDISVKLEQVRAILAKTGSLGGTPAHSYTAEKVEGYASGGTATSTAMALLHGTPQEPEYVLNARQTDAFLRLADVLPAALGNTNTIGGSYNGSATFNVEVNVGSISDDYDVDSLVARIKNDLYDAASYRNGNVLGFLR